MIKLVFDLEDDLYHELKRIAKAVGMSYSKLIRKSLEVAVKRLKYKKVNTRRLRKAKRGGFPLTNLAGVLKYGPKDLSSRVDDIYKWEDI